MKSCVAEVATCRQTKAPKSAPVTTFLTLPITELAGRSGQPASARSHDFVANHTWSVDSSSLPSSTLVSKLDTAQHAQYDWSGRSRASRQLTATPSKPATTQLESSTKDAGTQMLEDLQAAMQRRQSGNMASRPKPQSSDPNVVGFVPAFLSGDVFACQVPTSSEGKGKEPLQQLSTSLLHSVATAMLKAIGIDGQPSGRVGMFATKDEAQVAAKQFWDQQQRHSQQQQFQKSQSSESDPKGKFWPFDGVVDCLRQAPQLTQSMQPSSNKEDPVIKELNKANRMMREADKLLQSAEKKADAILYKEFSVVQFPLAFAIEMAVNFPNTLRLVTLGRRSAAGQDTLPQQGPWGGDKTVQQPVDAGMTAFTIPGISVAMPTTAGPINFLPVFTSRRTAERTWEVANALLAGREAARRKVQRQLKRAATELGATHLTGLHSRFEQVEPNEDEEGLAEPAEVQEFMQEMGENDPRSSKVKMRFKPKNPLDLIALAAVGVISLYARGAEACGNAADNALSSTPLGRSVLHKTGAPAIQEQPLQQAIADVREWNEQLRARAAAKLDAEHALRMTSLTSEQKAERDHRVMIFAAETKRSLQAQRHALLASNKEALLRDLDPFIKQAADPLQAGLANTADSAQVNSNQPAQQQPQQGQQAKQRAATQSQKQEDSGGEQEAVPHQQQANKRQHVPPAIASIISRLKRRPKETADSQQEPQGGTHGAHEQQNAVTAAAQTPPAQAGPKPQAEARQAQNEAHSQHAQQTQDSQQAQQQQSNQQQHAGQHTQQAQQAQSSQQAQQAQTSQQQPAGQHAQQQDLVLQQPMLIPKLTPDEFREWDRRLQRQERRQHRQKNVETRHRSQEEIDSMRMPDEFPGGNALKCVLKDGSQIDLLAGLQGVVAALQLAQAMHIRGNGSNVHRGGRLPILPLTDDVVGLDLSGMKDCTMATFHCDLPKATGKGEHAATRGNGVATKVSSDDLGRGLVLLGNMGIEEYKSGAACVIDRRKKGQLLVGSASVGFGNVSLLGAQIKQQQADSARLTDI